MVNSTDKKSIECCYPRCKCAYAMRKYRNRKKKKKTKLSKKEKSLARPYKTSKWLNALALKPPRALISQKMAYKGILTKRIINVLDKYFEQSMRTVYSQRSRFVRENYGRPQPKPKTMGKKDWKRHRKWLSKNALPKKSYLDKGKKRPRVPFDQLTRYKTLSKPKYRRRKYRYKKYDGKLHLPVSNVKRTALKHKASRRTRQLAIALDRFRRDKFNYDYGPVWRVSPYALIAQCSERTIKLAEPKKGPQEPIKKETKYGVAVNALQYTLTKRTKKLAKPKPIYVPRITDDSIVIEERELSPYGVSMDALKYKVTAKILGLAMPRVPPPEPIPEVPYNDKPRTKYNVVADALKYKISDRLLKLSKPK